MSIMKPVCTTETMWLWGHPLLEELKMKEPCGEEVNDRCPGCSDKE